MTGCIVSTNAMGPLGKQNTYQMNQTIQFNPAGVLNSGRGLLVRKGLGFRHRPSADHFYERIENHRRKEGLHCGQLREHRRSEGCGHWCGGDREPFGLGMPRSGISSNNLAHASLIYRAMMLFHNAEGTARWIDANTAATTEPRSRHQIGQCPRTGVSPNKDALLAVTTIFLRHFDRAARLLKVSLPPGVRVAQILRAKSMAISRLENS
jgi:hypothetical protein